jgi:hypothetical protein
MVRWDTHENSLIFSRSTKLQIWPSGRLVEPLEAASRNNDAMPSRGAKLLTLQGLTGNRCVASGGGQGAPAGLFQAAISFRNMVEREGSQSNDFGDA